MKSKEIILGMFVSLIILMSACEKDDTVATIDTTNDGTFKVFTQAGVTTVQNLMGDTIIGIAPNGQPYGSGKFTFFSLENKTLVPNSDSATTKWDIAFRGTTILINGGTSGPGSGGAFIWQGAFDNLKTIPADSVFRVDNAPSYAVPTGSNNGWYNYNGPTNLVTALPGRVLVIRTAKGKYAKLEILNYYKTGVTPAANAPDDAKLRNQRYFTYRFVFQPDGSKNL